MLFVFYLDVLVVFASSIIAVLCLQTPAWLTEMIEHPTWRSLIYRLAEEYPDCLMLNFTIKVCLYILVEI
jgi:hypothetical protein